MKKANTKKRLIAVAVMLLCILVSIPLGVRTALARGDDAAVNTFFDDGVYDVLTADGELAGNILRSSKVILQDMADYSGIGELQLAQTELETAYRQFESNLARKTAGRDTVVKMVGGVQCLSPGGAELAGRGRCCHCGCGRRLRYPPHLCGKIPGEPCLSAVQRLQCGSRRL